jgi:signal transduction histidine kinase
MDLRDATLRVYESSGPLAALEALARAVAAGAPLLAAAWIAPAGAVLATWPEGSAVCPSLAQRARAADAPSLVPCPAPPEAAATGEGDRTVLLLPLGDGRPGEGTLALTFGRHGAPGTTDGWAAPAAALAAVARRHRELREAEEERDTLRQRAEESEALHVLGLAANRTLDPDEVLDLVARFTRTLLGAHYVTVSTSEGGQIRTLASVGLRGGAQAGDDPFAGRVADAGKPLTLGTGTERWAVADFAFHGREGMQVGLGVPLSLFGETFGALVVGYRRPYELSPRDTRLALTLAGHAAVAISNARLHRALADRSRALEQAYEELRWSAEAKERFFASMSHELRTPLNAILGYQSLILDDVVGPVSPPTRPFLEKAYRATQGLLLLVNDVLDLSKIGAGRVDLAVLHTDLGEIVRDAMATVEPLAARKGIELHVAVPAGAPRLRTDPDRVRQILINLLSNAVKFTDAGRVSVAVERAGAAADEPRRLEGAALPAGWLDVRVSDTGPGIAAEDHERIFHEFEQVQGATARGGTGLGLPISRKLARLLGGDVRVESRPGHGAAFTLRLPLEPDPAAGEVA